MSKREVASIVWIAFSGGMRLLTKVTSSIIKAKSQVKRASKEFQKELEALGVPKVHAKEIAENYAAPAKEFLSIRNLMFMADRFD